MKNKVLSGHTLTASLAGVTVSGEPYDLGSGLIGVAANSAGAGEVNEFEISGVKEFAKEGSAYTLGEAVGYDDAVPNVVKSADAAKDFDLGTVVEAAGAGAAVIKVMVNGLPGPGPSYS